MGTGAGVKRTTFLVAPILYATVAAPAPPGATERRTQSVKVVP